MLEAHVTTNRRLPSDRTRLVAPSTVSAYPGKDYVRAMEDFRKEVVDAVADALGVTLAWSTSELGFPASPPPSSATVEGATSSTATKALQAAMLVRTALLAKGEGARRWHWHPFMGGIVTDTWESFSAMGLRIDVASRGRQFSAGTDAFRRSSWYTFQRLARLLHASERIEVHREHTNAVVVELWAAGAFRARVCSSSAGEGDDGGEPPSYPTAFVLWVDQAASVSQARTFRFRLNRRAYHRFSLVAAITRPATATFAEGGYASGETVDWDPAATCTGEGAMAEDGDGDEVYLDVTLDRTDPDTNPAPFCFFADAEFVSVLFTHSGSEFTSPQGVPSGVFE